MQTMQDETTRCKLSLISKLSDIEPNGRYALFIRHADRDKIPAGEFGDEVELNSLGFGNSVRYGKLLSHLKINKIFSSPIKRCLQTADYISIGYGQDINIQQSTLLGDPGAFVNDAKLAGRMYLEMGFAPMYEKLISGMVIPGNRNLNEAAGILNNMIISNSDPEGINIYVTHDLIVALFAYALFGKEYTPGTDWVKYLDGLIIKIETV